MNRRPCPVCEKGVTNVPEHIRRVHSTAVADGGHVGAWETIERPCEACHEAESGAEIGGIDLCGTCAARVEESPELRRRLPYLDWLTPIQQEAILACDVAGQTRADHAKDRGVEAATVSTTIRRGLKRLGKIVDEQEGDE